MEKTISMMVGKGSLNHNNRAFTAKNVDKERSQYNQVFVKEDIRKVYHELFDKALESYNDRQTRTNRKIDDYYDKIRTSKQEKLFHEVIVQIGNKDDTNCTDMESLNAMLALGDYMEEFQKRNPNLRVFNAVLHLDEETPHLHIDFVPFSKGNKRGLETKVSLKGALKAQGFVGTGRHDTEWKRWVESEKKCLAEIMKERNMEWKQKGTHEKHLSVYDFEKKMRKAEMEELEQKISQQGDRIAGQQTEMKVNEQTLAFQRENIREWREKKAETEELQRKAEQALEMAKRKLELVEAKLERATIELHELQKEMESLVEHARQSYDRYSRVAVTDRQYELFEDVVQLKQENEQLKAENRTLREKLQKAYDFMKQFTINGINLLERFLESVGERVQNFTEHLRR